MELIFKIDDEGNKTITGFDNVEAVVDLSDDEKIINIDRKAFLSCKSLKKLILPRSIEKIDDWAFSKCSSLKSINFEGEFKEGIFGKGVFDGCTNIEKISFSNFDEDTVKLLAVTTNRLKNEQLLRSQDIGEKSWFDKWDMTLLSLLKADDSEGSIDATVCGEEDTSYNGMVDGEMPGDSGDFIKNAGKNKSLLCFERLKYNKHLDNNTKDVLENYVKDRSFNSKYKYAWTTLKEDKSDDLEYFKLYLDIVKPDKNIIDEMIKDLSSNQVQAKAFLIEEASNQKTEDSFFDDLLF